MNDALYQLYMKREVVAGGVPARSARPERAACEPSGEPAPARRPPWHGQAAQERARDADLSPVQRHATPSAGELQSGDDRAAEPRTTSSQHLRKQPDDRREGPAGAEGHQAARFGTGVIGTRDIVIFTRQFATMINSGLPLVQALDILSKQTENKAAART